LIDLADRATTEAPHSLQQADRPSRRGDARRVEPMAQNPRVKIPPTQPREDAEAEIRAAVLAYPPAIRKALLRVILAPQEQRAVTIGRLYAEPDGREAAELLIDLEEDRTLALTVADVVKAAR
jgi:hypothetical protein